MEDKFVHELRLMLSRFDLRGRVAVITGAAGLLGQEHAAALLECGACIVLTDIKDVVLAETAEQLCRIYGREQIFTRPMDVSDRSSIEAAQKEILKRCKRTDILINNAAIDPKVKAESLVETSRFEHFPLEQWQFQIRVGLTGAMLCLSLIHI